MIKHYYGEEFYNLDSDSQRRQIVTIHKYLKNSRSIISEWICDYLFLLDSIKSIYQSGREDEIRKYLEGFKQEYNNRSVFACRTSLLIVKLYHILYRLQNKKYEEVDYNKVDFDTTRTDYIYERTDIDGSITTDFNIDKLKLQQKNPTLSDKELEIKAICEIIRNALSHGNIEMTFKLDNNTIIENIVFTDIYHSKTRKLEMSLDKLEILLNSEAFTTKECVIKEENDYTLSK